MQRGLVGSEMCIRDRYQRRVHGDDNNLKVTVPPYRTDILHKCDVMEDVIIAIGLNNLKPELPEISGTSGKQLPINKLTNEIRRLCANAKFNECLTLCLTAKEDHFTKMRKPIPEDVVTLSNPISTECDIARTSLMPGLMQCLASNASSKIPIRFFEIGDVVELDKTTETGARNHRKLAALICDKSAKFDKVHGLLDYIMNKLGIPFNEEKGYSIRIGKNPSFIENAQLEVIHNKNVIGELGIVHPEVLTAYKWSFPVSMIELDMEYISKVFFGQPNHKYFEFYLSYICLLYTSPSPRDLSTSRMPSSA
eukprot:TRINITY_DN4858_c0_g2_i1.p1 TRINITY_DN4858_c0_g2~~TRINITY_DN4858_c0_g2_i1.p1  ORF type:complete len:309 (+),score=59.12 TRINITY_DN4858_c0_g2_i1:118-1044(+)